MVDNNISIKSSSNTGTIIGVQNNYQIPKVPTILSKVIKIISDISCELDENNSVDYIPYFPTEKLEYNNVSRYKDIICEYSKYYNICDKTLNMLDNNEVGTRGKILNEIHIEYELVLSKYKITNNKERIDVIRKNADDILEKMIEVLSHKINETNNTENLTQEDIMIGVIIVICFAFIECKILDKPKGENIYAN